MWYLPTYEINPLIKALLFENVFSDINIRKIINEARHKLPDKNIASQYVDNRRRKKYLETADIASFFRI